MKPAASLYDRILVAANAVAERLDAQGTEVAIVLGSGLATDIERLSEARAMDYALVPGFPETTVAGHPGRLVCGTWGGHKVLLLCGRVHAYEGYPAAEVGFGVRMAAALGATTLVATNVSGGVDPALELGEIVCLRDHINLTGASPLTGSNDERLGPRFLDMTHTYTPALRALALEAAQAVLGKPIREGVYAGMMGPSYETPAEVRMLRVLGADLVGMSTIHEVIAARHAGLQVLGLSLVSNPAAGIAPTPLSHEEVTTAAAAGAGRMNQLIEAFLSRLPASAE